MKTVSELFRAGLITVDEAKKILDESLNELYSSMMQSNWNPSGPPAVTVPGKLIFNGAVNRRVMSYTIRDWKYFDGRVILEDDHSKPSVFVENRSSKDFVFWVGHRWETIAAGGHLWTSEKFADMERYIDDHFNRPAGLQTPPPPPMIPRWAYDPNENYSCTWSQPCKHEWETKWLFTSSYEACKLCKEERK